MGNENVFQVGGVATGLGIEVCTAIAKASVTDDLHHCLGQFEVVNGELVCIPAVLVVTTVGVDGAEHTVVYGYCEFVLEGVARQSSVVHFDVHLEIFVQIVSLQEADNGFGVYIILVFCRFHRFRFNQEGTFEAAGTCIVAGDGQHLCEVLFLTLLVCIQQ